MTLGVIPQPPISLEALLQLNQCREGPTVDTIPECPCVGLHNDLLLFLICVRWRRTQGGANGNPQVYRRGQRCERPRGVPATLQPALTRPESLTTTVATGRESSWFTLRWRKLLDLTNETDRGRTRGLHTADLEISKLYHCSLPIKRPQLLQKKKKGKISCGLFGRGAPLVLWYT